MYSEIINRNTGTSLHFMEKDSVYGITVYTVLNITMIYNLVDYIIEETIINSNNQVLWYRHIEDTSPLGELAQCIRYYSELCELA